MNQGTITQRVSKTAANNKISLEQYLEKVARFSDSDYGNLIRNRFKDIKGGSEKEKAESLTDEQVQKIAADAQIDPANFAIFINGYALNCKRRP